MRKSEAFFARFRKESHRSCSSNRSSSPVFRSFSACFSRAESSWTITAGFEQHALETRHQCLKNRPVFQAIPPKAARPREHNAYVSATQQSITTSVSIESGANFNPFYIFGPIFGWIDKPSRAKRSAVCFYVNKRRRPLIHSNLYAGNAFEYIRSLFIGNYIIP